MITVRTEHVKLARRSLKNNGVRSSFLTNSLVKRYTGEKLKDIGTYFGIGESGVSQAIRRVKDKIRNDKKLEKKLSASKMKTPLFSFPLSGSVN